MKIRPCL